MLTKLPLNEYLQAVKPKGISDVLRSPAGSISHLIHERGSVEVKAMLVDQIVNLTKFFNFSRTMDIHQVSETADLIIDQYPIYTPEDFILCFKNIKVLKYGKFYEGIDGSKILEMIRAYDLVRDEEIFEFRRIEASRHKNDLRTMPDEVAEIAKTVLGKLGQPVVENRLGKNEDVIQRYITEFDDLYDTQSPTGLGLRFVEYDGEKMDCQKYCFSRYNKDSKGAGNTP